MACRFWFSKTEAKAFCIKLAKNSLFWRLLKWVRIIQLTAFLGSHETKVSLLLIRIAVVQRSGPSSLWLSEIVSTGDSHRLMDLEIRDAGPSCRS